MNFLFDVFLILVFLLVVIVATMKGFVKSIWRTVTIVGAFILAYVFGIAVGEWICDNFVLDHVTSYSYGIVSELVEENADKYDVSGLFETLPQEFTDLLANCGTDIEELTSRYSNTVTVSEEDLYSMAQSIALPISGTLSNAVGVITVFMVSLLILSLVGLLLKVVVKIPIIRSIDSFLGFVFGLAEGLVVIWILCVFTGLFVEHSFMSNSSNEVLNELTDASRILKFFCKLSPVDFINISVE